MLADAESITALCFTEASAASWSTSPRAELVDLRRDEHVGHHFRAAGFVSEVGAPVRAQIPGDSLPETPFAGLAKLKGPEGTVIETIGITDSALFGLVEEAARSRNRVEFLLRVYCIPEREDTAQMHFVVQLLDVRRADGLLDALGATDAERGAALSLLEALSTADKSPLEYLFNEVTTGLAIVGLDELQKLRMAIAFNVLAALSGGAIDNAGGRLHGLCVGPPGQGKKMIGAVAAVLNVNAEWASPSKISAAGLVGASVHKNGRWESQPGLAARADPGVVIIQDAHGISSGEMRKLGPIFQEWIEDAVLRDGKAGGVSRPIDASLWFDVNRTSQLQAGSTSTGGEAAILLLRPLLSRLDFICEIFGNAERSLRVAEQMYAPNTALTGLARERWARGLKVLTATLRDRNPVIDLTGVFEEMEGVHRDLFDRAGSDFFNLPEASDIPARLTVTFKRLVTASARGNDRSRAVSDDVQAVAWFLEAKLRYFRLLAPTSVEAIGSLADERRTFIMAFEGSVIEEAAVRAQYRAKFGREWNERTFRRDMKNFGAVRVKNGRYHIRDRLPTTAQANPSGESERPNVRE